MRRAEECDSHVQIPAVVMHVQFLETPRGQFIAALLTDHNGR